MLLQLISKHQLLTKPLLLGKENLNCKDINQTACQHTELCELAQEAENQMH
jgi:hypothetical protein